MAPEHILPAELRYILRQIAIEIGDGPEVEGGLIFEDYIEKALKEGGISSEIFHDEYPNLSPSLKKMIAIDFLYDIAQTELNVKIEMPRFTRSPNGPLREITVIEHLNNLSKLFALNKK